MTAYRLNIPGITTAQEITRSTEALEAKERRRRQLEEIRQRRKEQYKQFLARCRKKEARKAYESAIESAGNLLLHFDHPQIALRLVICKGHRPVFDKR